MVHYINNVAITGFTYATGGLAEEAPVCFFEAKNLAVNASKFSIVYKATPIGLERCLGGDDYACPS